MLIDFHCHTHYSDGSLSPEAIHAMMLARGVEIYAISDHDSLRAHTTLNALAEKSRNPQTSNGPKRVVGVEINTTYANNEVHVLGYGIAAQGSTIDAVLAENQKARLARLQIMIEELAAAEMPISYEEVVSAAGSSEAIGRPHVAQAMVQRGYASDVQTAIKRFLCRDGIGYVASVGISPFEAIEAIHGAGGVAVLAHPCRLDDYGIIEVLARAGIDGLELYYPRHTPEQMDIFRHEAQRFGLIFTGGSDFHSPHHNPRGVGMEVDPEDLKPFLEIVPSS